MYPRKTYGAPWITTLVLALYLAGGGATAAAQRIEDDQLLVEASRSAREDDWLAVSNYLFAYISREPRGMRDNPAQERALRTALENAELNLQIAFAGGGGNKSLPSDPVRVDIPRPATSRSGDRRQSQPRSYPLACRGGGEMFFNYYAREDRREVQVHFLKAEWSGSKPALAPGTCSWLDRPVNDEEPFWLALDVPSSGAGIGRLWSDEARNAKNLDDLRVRIRQISGTKLRWLLEHVVSRKRFVVWSYNDGRYLRVTRVAPSR